MTNNFTADDFYDVAYHERIDDIDFYLKIAQQYGKDGMLEMGCGTGRVLIEVAKKGIPIDGLDPNEHRINICKDKLAELPVEIRKNVSLSVSTIQDYKTDKKYSLITMPFRVFQHMLTQKEQEDVLNVTKKLLKQNGLLVIDIFNPHIKMLASDEFKKEFGESHYTTAKGMPFVRKDRIADRDYFKQLQFCEEIYEFDDGGKHHKIVNKYITRYTFKPELENLLKYMGFEVLETYGDFKGTEFGKTPYAGDIIMFSKVKER